MLCPFLLLYILLKDFPYNLVDSLMSNLINLASSKLLNKQLDIYLRSEGLGPIATEAHDFLLHSSGVVYMSRRLPSYSNCVIPTLSFSPPSGFPHYLCSTISCFIIFLDPAMKTDIYNPWWNWSHLWLVKHHCWPINNPDHLGMKKMCSLLQRHQAPPEHAKPFETSVLARVIGSLRSRTLPKLWAPKTLADHVLWTYSLSDPYL